MSDPSDTDIDAGTDSPILRELRAENKRLKKLAEELPNQVRGQVQREFTASKLLDDAGYPKLAPLFLEKHTNDEPTAEAVAEWLGGFGLEPRTGGPVVDTSGLAQTVTFADRVAAKAAEPLRAVEEQIAKIAETPNITHREYLQKVGAVFQEAGLPVITKTSRF
jgi:hypothetical protein